MRPFQVSSSSQHLRIPVCISPSFEMSVLKSPSSDDFSGSSSPSSEFSKLSLEESDDAGSSVDSETHPGMVSKNVVSDQR